MKKIKNRIIKILKLKKMINAKIIMLVILLINNIIETIN